MNSSSGSSTVTMSQSSLVSSKKASTEISKIYKQASQLFLTRRLPEALSALHSVITPPAQTNGNSGGDHDAPFLAPIATATTSQRIKVWSLYGTLLNAIVDLGIDDGKRDFGQKEYKTIVAAVRSGDVWEQVVCDGYGGREGSVDAEVVYNLATLLLGQAPSQKLNQSRLETYLSSSSHPNLDISSHLVKSSSRRPQSQMNGADTPKELSSRLKLLELFTLHVLPRNEEWDYARSFLTNSDILDDERRESFLQTLQEIQDSLEVDDRAEELDFHRERDEDLKRQQKQDEIKRAEEGVDAMSEEPVQNGTVHKRTSSEVDYGIEKSHPNGVSMNANADRIEGKALAKPHTPPAPTGHAQFSPPPDTPKHRHVRKSPQSQSNDMFSQARQLIRALQSLVRNMAGAVTGNSTMLFRTFLFVLAILMAFSRRDLRERVKRITGNSWEKIRATIGMGVKVSYI